MSVPVEHEPNWARRQKQKKTKKKRKRERGLYSSSSDSEDTPSSLPILEQMTRVNNNFTSVSNGNTAADAQAVWQQQDQMMVVNSTFTTARPTIIIYPTVPPQTVIIPIICSIIIFPIVAASAICLLRYYNQRARAKDRFRAGFQQGASAMFAMGRIGATSNVGKKKPEPVKAPINRFQCMPELELDTVFEGEERDGSDDIESSSSLQNCVAQLNQERAQREPNSDQSCNNLHPPTLASAKKTMQSDTATVVSTSTSANHTNVVTTILNTTPSPVVASSLPEEAGVVI